MNANTIKFDGKDLVKLVGFCAVVMGMWYDLKTDLQVFKATTELRLERLEGTPERPRLVYKRPEAIMPHEIKIETE